MRTTREPQWTPRQREVLDLLVRGKTNGEIASALGISLDGAKWHVSEIITRLGVDSRDEAAEYWRHHNGLRMRFTRIASGFFSSGALKWSMGTALVAGVVVAAAMVIVALRESGGDEPDQGGGIQNPDTSTPDPSVPATATPPPAVTPLPSGETVAGVPVGLTSYGQPGSLPVPLSVIVERGCYACDAPADSFDRVSLDGSGNLKVEEIFKAPSGYIHASYWDAAGREHYISVCSRGYCGGVGQVSADAQTTLYRSRDGGITWEDAGTAEGAASVASLTQQGPLLNLSTFANGTSDYRFQVLGQSQVVRPPAGTEPVLARGQLIGWRKPGTREILKVDGTPLVTLPDVPGAVRPVQVDAVLADGTILISWLGASGGAQPSTYVGVMTNGALVRAFKGDASLSIGSLLTQGVGFGNVAASPTDVDPSSSDNRDKYHPAWIDLHTGEINLLELYGPAFGSGYDSQRNVIRLVEPGPYVRVTGAGDCLNVREAPSTTAPVIACFADNVLLRNLNAEQQADGVTWWKVQTPSGQTGWASREFLEGAQAQQ